MVALPNPRTFIITGGSSGIGLAAAQTFIGRGDNVVLNGRDEKKLHAAAEGLGALGRVALVAKAALYLTGADFVTSAILHVDGGIETGV